MVRKPKKDDEGEGEDDDNLKVLTAEEYKDFTKMREDWRSATALYVAFYRLVIAFGAVAAALAAIKVTFGAYLTRMFAP